MVKSRESIEELEGSSQKLGTKEEEIGDLNTNIASKVLKHLIKATGVKSHRFLARKLSHKINKGAICLLKGSNNMQLTKITDIVESFKAYYSALFSLDKPCRAEIMRDLQKNLNKSPSQEQKDFLDAEVTEDEVVKVIKNLKNGKSLERDGLPVESYKTLSVELVTPLAKLLHLILEKAKISETWQEARPVMIYQSLA